MRIKTFGEFLESCVDEGGPLGDLAQDFVRDCEGSRFEPSDYKTAAAVRTRMVGLRACREALDTLAMAARQYDLLKGRRSAKWDKEVEAVLGGDL